ncbi:hypothetical protein EDM57_02785 [Brevibacillus gelatini]|uniref:Uncharacterized protein n=1 Tax=Brevibacillus gelatini TaxID=1655277 RepID=A0A3M8BB25_9BACL|nr:hypothetical protein [Brevibacillus gelatini]RNB60247.1 hypothetical protein EDM57_02785 [Brevibacillus gelatini]
MAKREQLGAEGLKEQQPAQEEEKEVRSIARARAAYEQLMDEIWIGYMNWTILLRSSRLKANRYRTGRMSWGNVSVGHLQTSSSGKWFNSTRMEKRVQIF